MAKNDYYQTLGVGREATAAEIKKAYKKLAMKHHPDRNQGDKSSEKKFKELSEAYEVLKDPQKRAAYDQLGHSAFDGSGGFGGDCCWARCFLPSAILRQDKQDWAL